MKISYDFHIHTDLSPCGHELMTPRNIVHMSKLLGKHAIAITDHNTCKNCEVTMKLGQEEGLLVIPGMEIECMEGFHLIALFPTIQKAYGFEAWIEPYRLHVKNKPHIFGHQYVLDEKDGIKEEISDLLITAIQLSVEVIVEQVRSLGGICYPAHIDRNSYSILANLGAIPDHLGFKCVEVANKGWLERHKAYGINYGIVRSSDAHDMETFCVEDYWLDVNCLTIESVLQSLK